MTTKKAAKATAELDAENARFDDDDNEIENGDDGDGEAETRSLEGEDPEITELARVVGANVSDTVSNAAKRLKDMAVT